MVSSKKRLFWAFFPLITLVLGTTSYAAGHAPWPGQSFDGSPCSGHTETYGPYDYLYRHEQATGSPRIAKGSLRVVEKYHFNSSVESLTRGMTTVSPLGDLSYTLHAWPNHHRALNTAIKARLQTWPKYNRKYPTAECYLQRAIKFSPKDGITHMLYGMLLQRTGKKDKAVTSYKKAIQLLPHNMQIKYNYALLLVDLKKYKEAKAIASKVYQQGFPLPGLRNKLKRAGKW